MSYTNTIRWEDAGDGVVNLVLDDPNQSANTMNADFGASLTAAVDRLEAELGGREFLVGDAFTVADLTAASLLYPLALPPEGPWRPQHLPAKWIERHDEVRDRPAIRWVNETYARHRNAAAREPALAGR